MPPLTAVTFPTASGADVALEMLERLQREEAIVIDDGAVVAGGELQHTNMSTEQEARLRGVFAEAHAV